MYIVAYGDQSIALHNYGEFIRRWLGHGGILATVNNGVGDFDHNRQAKVLANLGLVAIDMVKRGSVAHKIVVLGSRTQGAAIAAMYLVEVRTA